MPLGTQCGLQCVASVPASVSANVLVLESRKQGAQDPRDRAAQVQQRPIVVNVEKWLKVPCFVCVVFSYGRVCHF